MAAFQSFIDGDDQLNFNQLTAPISLGLLIVLAINKSIYIIRSVF